MEDIAAGIGNNYVRIGTLLVPPSEVVKTLHRYAKPLICENDWEGHPFSIRGTTTAMNICARYFYLFSRHQIKDYDPGAIAIFPLAARGEQLIGGGTGHWIEPTASNDGEEFLDVFGMEIEPESYTIQNLSSEFFPVIVGDCWPTNTTGSLIAFGVPSELQNYSPAEDDVGSGSAIEFLTVVVSGRHRQASHARWVHEAQMIRTEEFPVDGLSGGPVFHLGRDAHGHFIGLAGMIMRGGPKSFYFVDTGFLLRYGVS